VAALRPGPTHRRSRSPAGVLGRITTAGVVDYPALAPVLPANLPFELAADNTHGKIYVTDFNAGVVTQVDMAGGVEPFPTASTRPRGRQPAAGHHRGRRRRRVVGAVRHQQDRHAQPRLLGTVPRGAGSRPARPTPVPPACLRQQIGWIYVRGDPGARLVDGNLLRSGSAWKRSLALDGGRDGPEGLPLPFRFRPWPTMTVPSGGDRSRRGQHGPVLHCGDTGASGRDNPAAGCPAAGPAPTGSTPRCGHGVQPATSEDRSTAP
jgi:hypothetical protein